MSPYILINSINLYPVLSLSLSWLAGSLVGAYDDHADDRADDHADDHADVISLKYTSSSPFNQYELMLSLNEL